MTEHKLRVLVIDDDPDIQEAARMVLESANYEVDGAPDGDEGLRKVAEFKPDLIILDVMMRTQTEGFHVAYKLRDDKETSSIPILMLTAVQEKLKVRFSPNEDGEFLPVDAFVEKPIEPGDLLFLVKKLIDESRATP